MNYTMWNQIKEILDQVEEFMVANITAKKFRTQIDKVGARAASLRTAMDAFEEADRAEKAKIKQELIAPVTSPPVPPARLPATGEKKPAGILQKARFHVQNRNGRNCLEDCQAYEKEHGVFNLDRGGPPIQAKMRDQCGWCPEPINIGDWIVVRSHKIQREVG